MVPTYNEISRGSQKYWEELVLKVEANFIFVDDFSSDATVSYLSNFSKSSGVHVVKHYKNLGKGEAIRTGLKHALSQSDSGLVAFLDADGAFSVNEVNRILKYCEKFLLGQTYDAVWTSRVKMAGRQITRNKFRHLTGRVISSILGICDGNLPYDTQCGFKVFAINDELSSSLNEPFLTRWLFDIELLKRLKALKNDYKVREEPLEEWHEIGSSTLRPKSYLRIVHEILIILKELKRGS